MKPDAMACRAHPAERHEARAPTHDGAALGLTTRTVSLPSGRCVHVDEGNGRPVVLLHGAPLTSLSFLRVIRELRTGHRVLAPDFPGFGQSVEASGFVATLDGYAQFVHEFVEALDLRDYVVFVHDSSACVGLSGVGKAPDRVGGIVVADTVPMPLTGRAWPVKLALRHLVSSRLVRFLNRHLNLLAWMVVCVAPLLRRFSRLERRVLLAQFDSAAKRERTLDLFREMGRDDAFMQRTASTIRHKLSGIPTLIIYGQLDPMRFVGGPARFKRAFTNSTLWIVPLEEHFPMLASGRRVGEKMRQWMQGLPRKQARSGT